ncbi:CAZyme family GT71 [Aspergillus niger]|uniref:Glycosyltransferase 28 N-terminal domain family protein n=2 Tax=Aspergillus niger TaxID=5061 RepID=A0A254UDM6_ASPNG|nr:CAZyme family GT71 [Aspergillus niger]KAI2864272.1 CAZyme family GT71 [Aspergillus niger]KAI2945157.1 CAZyme family GT71 [Aspergillus niger]KAI2974402.1 CAZyme family GT71 [Aspergillus niger]KAI2988760.1 CAZyme family GT71 [Aspergillus niger]
MTWDESRKLFSHNMSQFAAIRSHRGFRIIFAAVAVIFALSIFMLLPPASSTSQVFGFGQGQKPATHSSSAGTITIDTTLITDISQYFADHPIQKPFKEKFGELGRRNRVLRDWLIQAEASQDSTTKSILHNAIEGVAIAQYPFLQPPKQPQSHHSRSSHHPVQDLRASFEPNSAGIVIPTSDYTLRYAAHLIASLRFVLNSTLPIQVVYAGDDDLSPTNRNHLSTLAASGPAITFLNILTVFDDTTLKLQTGGWAIKPFAALASPFEKVILADADAVFLQPPEVLLQHDALVNKGALLFHDRLLWKHAFEGRHEWWRDQIRRPSKEMDASLVWTEDYAEEADSGLVVLDKSRPDTFMGLLHICWQNTYEVREETTYKITYGDKESWWFGLELSGAEYEFSKHYGGIVGWENVDDKERVGVCSFVIAHVDAKGRLLWYNGSLLKNKGQAGMEDVYEVPDKWMIDAEWVKGSRKQDHSCMVGGEVRDLTKEELDVLERSIAAARQVDTLVRTD